MSKPVLTLEAQGGPAFPLHAETMADCEGISLRDYFAIHADISGFEFSTADIAASFLGLEVPTGGNNELYQLGVEIQAALRYRIADAMLAARLRAVSQP